MKYREVKRLAKMCERIKVIECGALYGAESDVIDISGNGCLVKIIIDGERWWIPDQGYVVLEPIEETKEENMEERNSMATIDYEAENENLRRLCDYQREKNRQLLKAYTNLARYIDICEDGKIRGLEGL